VRDRVRFIHAADLHLDAPFTGLTSSSGRIGSALAEATYEAFRRIVDTAIAREVDFVVIAGDAYNSRDKSLRAQLRFREQMLRLAQENIEVFVVQGNHDPADGWSAGLPLPANVHVFPADRVGRAEVVRDGELIAAVYGRGFARRDTTENLALGYHREAADPVAIGVLHSNVGSNAEYETYAPSTIDDLRAGGMDYWALGHIHKQGVLAQNPWVVYAGSPQGINPKETGPHGCYVVEVSPGGTVALEHVEAAHVAWARVELDCSAANDLDSVRSLLTRECENLLARENRAVVARFSLTGRCAAHADLARPGVLSQLLDDVRAEQGAGDPWVWVDRIDDRTAAVLDLDAVRSGVDFAAEIVRVADELESDEAALRALLDEIAAPVATTLAGYEQGVEPRDTLQRARDVALDELLGGEVR
jgi:DNA repair exonuclease SbcCD nuclease subunit